MDLFEDIKNIIGCDYISDLPGNRERVYRILSENFFMKYPKEQRDDFDHYMSKTSPSEKL